MAVLRLEKLRIRNLGPVDLVVGHKECVCLSGASGTGKTSLLRAVADLDPHDGRVYLDETDSRQVEPATWRREVAMLPERSQWWRDTVGEHFVTHADAGLSQLDLDARIMHRPVSSLSAGERHRLALLRMLGNEPKVLLLDEPTGSLDEASASRVVALVARYRESAGAAVLWVTHNLAQVARMSDRHLSISGGRLVSASRS
ncbi:MAG: ATP-binding cassette domain-containing protein [Gammaproteobacteria bacterium]|nr:ATP-binding cassette domain-containing protein [Gammaproteobacteria bacterium]